MPERDKPGFYYAYGFYPQRPEKDQIRVGTVPADDPRAAMNRAKAQWPDAAKIVVSKPYKRPSRSMFK